MQDDVIQRGLEIHLQKFPEVSYETIQGLFHSLADIVQSGEECRKRFRGSMNLLWPVDPRRRLAERLLLKYLDHFEYEILDTDGPIRVRTSLSRLKEAAEKNPIIGSRYDLLFNNCQLYLVHLLYKQYDVEGVRIPWNIGALVAAPLLVIMESIFILAYLHFGGNSSLNQIPFPAMAFGFLWIPAEILFLCIYLNRLA